MSDARAPDPGPAAAGPALPADPAASYRRANRRLWDVWTRLHLSGGYDVAGFRAGKSTLQEVEVAELGDVSGRSLLHLQCHFGLDTLSWARRGAAVTGADFSPQAIATARALSAETGTPGRFVCADLYALPGDPVLRVVRFDVVFSSYGVLSWLPDLAGWARVVAHFLVPGGAFHLVEFHPFVYLLDPETHDSAGNPLDHGYFYRPDPVRAVYRGSYAHAGDGELTTAYFWDHPLGEVVTALCAAGLRLEFLNEHPRPAGETYHRAYPDHLPFLYSLKATRPA